MQTILITGGAGFIGSNLATMLKTSITGCRVIAFDNLKRRGSELNVARLQQHSVEFVHGDIRNPEDFESLPKVDVIIECSAEPSVLAGLGSSAKYVVNTNLAGTVNCLEFAVKCNSDFIFLSTSRVYPVAELNNIDVSENETRFTISASQKTSGVSLSGISENFPMEGYRTLYGATKLASELLILEYAELFGLRTVINRCGVITGPWQMGKADQGFVVLWMARHFWKQPLQYIGFGGTGKQVRDTLHIHDLFRLMNYQLEHIDELDGELFNVGGGNFSSTSLLELTQLCRSITGNTVEIKPISEMRKGDIPIYITDHSKVTSQTGWMPEKNTEQQLKDIFDWLCTFESQLKPILAP